MNSEKLVSYEISSEEEETDQQEEVQDDSVGTKRSYECTFCRRGFTNAQALGGHMNIHRKDRAKAKKVTTHTSFSLPTNRFTNEESMAPPFTSEISDQPTRHYSILESERNYDSYFHPSSAPPNRRNQPPAYYAFEHEVHNPTTSRLMNTNQELQGANLSLQIGSSHVGNDTNQVRRGTQGDNEVDLELRLGHDPY